MTIPTNPSELFTPFLPSTYNLPEENDRWADFLGKTFSEVSDVVNDKIIGCMTQNVSSQNGRKLIFDTTRKVRNGSQYMARVVDYPAGGVLVLPMPPNINPQWVIYQVWGSASKPPTALNAGDGDFFSFYNEGSSKITFTMTDLNITITTVGLGTGYSGFIFLDFIPDGQ